MTDIDALMEVLAEFDAAYPDRNMEVTDGVYRAVAEAPVSADDGSWTRLPFKITSGDVKGLHASTFLKWFGESEKQVQTRRSITKRTLKSILTYNGGQADATTLSAGFSQLRAATAPSDAAEAIERVGRALEGTDVYIEVVTKDGYTNVNVLPPDSKKIVNAEELASLSV